MGDVPRGWDPVAKCRLPRTVRRERQWRWLVDLHRRFWGLVERRGPDECWPWLGATTRTGYGAFGVKGDGDRLGTTAQRVAWMLTHGSIPDDMTVDHLCYTPGCQNAERHMRLLPLSENVREGKWRRKQQHQT